MKHAIITILCCCLSRLVPAQVKWSDDSLVFSNIQWNNHSTSYMGKDSDTIPLLITAIPYNGIYEMGDHDDRTAVNLTFSGSSFRFCHVGHWYRE